MSMLQKFATGTKAMAATNLGSSGVMYAAGEYSYEIPNTEPTDGRTTAKADGTYDKPYTNWKAANYTTSAEKNYGGATKIDGTTAVTDTVNRWYNLYKMWRYRKILKRHTKYNHTNMSA